MLDPVEWDWSEQIMPTDECNVIFLLITGEAGKVWKAAKGRDARKDRVGLG